MCVWSQGHDPIAMEDTWNAAMDRNAPLRKGMPARGSGGAALHERASGMYRGLPGEDKELMDRN